MIGTSVDLAWQTLHEVTSQWFHEPNPTAIRAALATVAALELNQHPTWLMIVGPPASGKTELYLPLASAHANTVYTSDLNIPGLLSLAKDRKGQGILAKLGVRGIWLIKDFGSILGMRDERRNELMGAMREIYDGSWRRDMGSGGEPWTGHVNVVAAATTAVERFHRVQTDLGDRFVQVRVNRATGVDLWRKAARQAGLQAKIRLELRDAAARILKGMSLAPKFPDGPLDTVYHIAEFVCQARTPTHREKYSQSITDVGETEGSVRVAQEFAALAVGDAATHQSVTVGEPQLAFLRQLANDSIPLHRANVLRNVPLSDYIKRADLYEISGERWGTTFDRALDELVAVGILEQKIEQTQTLFKYRDRALPFAKAIYTSPITY